MRGALSILLAALFAACAASDGSASPARQETAAPGASQVVPSVAPSPTLAIPAPTGVLLALRPYTDATGPQSAVLIDIGSGATVELGRALDVAWTADGAAVHVVRQDERCVPRLLTYRTDGTAGPVIDGLAPLDRSFRWSPDGGSIAFLRYRNGPPPGACGSQGGVDDPATTVSDLVVMRADGTGQRVLVAGGWPAAVAWSPDGSRIAYRVPMAPLESNSRGIEIVDVATGGVRHLAGPLTLEGLAWSPDGTAILAGLWDGSLWTIGVIDTADGAVRAIASATEVHDAAWSPDGRRVAAATDVVDGSAIVGGDLTLWDRDQWAASSAGPHDLQTFARAPAWSPDGGWLAVTIVAGGQGGFGGIVLVARDSRVRHAVPDSAGLEVVAFRPAP